MKTLVLEKDADTQLPVDLRLLKSMLRVDHDDMDAAIATVHLPAAVAWAEAEMNRSILSKVHRLIIDDFPRTYDQRLQLPGGKTQSVSSIVYTPQSGNNITLTGPSSGSPAGTDYREELRGNAGGFVMPNDGESWPSPDTGAPTPILITFTAGWPLAEIPADIINALVWYVGEKIDIVGPGDLASGQVPNMWIRDRLLSSWTLR